jgi:putative DNA primase/helicase
MSKTLENMDKAELKAELAEVNAVMQWCLKSESAKLTNAMLDLARSEPGIPILPGDFDRDPWLFNCPNGTLELRTGKLREHRREDHITKLCPTEYHPGAECRAG